MLVSDKSVISLSVQFTSNELICVDVFFCGGDQTNVIFPQSPTEDMLTVKNQVRSSV